MGANHLLVLDDDLRTLQFLAEVARHAGYDTTLASSIDRFLEAYGVCEPSLIILDLQYRDGDGIAVLSALKQRGCAAPIVLISGYDGRVLEAAQRVGEGHGLRVAAALTKPLRLADLRGLLDAHRRPELAEWAEELRTAIDDGQVVAHYQPKVEVASGRVVGFEALARWSHPARGPIGPDLFIPIAEEAGMIGPLTDHVLGHALADCARWAAAGHALSVAVNVSASGLATPHLLEQVQRLLREHGVPAGRLTLEVTEGTAMSKGTGVLELLGRLRLHGVGLSLDDFGTGFSNLALLHRMPFNELKIDRSFVTGLKDDRESQVIVKALGGLARTLGLTAVAEGVEDLEAWPWLRSAGIDQAQGYAIARPMAGARVLDWLAEYAPPRAADAGSNIA